VQIVGISFVMSIVKPRVKNLDFKENVCEFIQKYGGLPEGCEEATSKTGCASYLVPPERQKLT
jgi:hypothetical protein